MALATLLAAMLLGAPASSQDDAATISLGIGIQKLLAVPGVARVAIGDPSVVDVLATGSQLLLVGRAEGRTTLLIWKANGSRLSYLVSVQKKDADKTIEEIKELLGDREGITVRKVGERIYLEGYAFTTDDAERASQVAEIYPQVTNFVTIAPNAKKILANNINAALQRAGLKGVQVSVVGTTIFLEGSVESQQDLEKAGLIVKAMGGR